VDHRVVRLERAEGLSRREGSGSGKVVQERQQRHTSATTLLVVDARCMSSSGSNRGSEVRHTEFDSKTTSGCTRLASTDSKAWVAKLGRPVIRRHSSSRRQATSSSVLDTRPARLVWRRACSIATGSASRLDTDADPARAPSGWRSKADLNADRVASKQRPMASTDKYDRQLRLWGAHGQVRRCRKRSSNAAAALLDNWLSPPARSSDWISFLPQLPRG